MRTNTGHADTPFKQQKLKAWQPILTPNWVIGTFAVVGLIFIPIGIVLHTASENVGGPAQWILPSRTHL